MKHFNRTVTVLVFIFLYIPMIVLGIASFNAGTDIATFKGFTLSQYANLFRDSALLRLLLNSLIIAVLSTLAATVFGTMAAVGIHGMNGKLRSAVMTLTNIPMTNPDIVTGVALALLFAFTGAMLRINSILGFWTLLIAHITFNLPYVILNVMPKLKQMDKDLVEAALDLGCTPAQVFSKVILPLSGPGILSGITMVFVPAVSTFYISQKLGSTGTTLIGDVIESQFKTAYNPNLGAAMSLVLMVLIFICVAIMNHFGEGDEEEVIKV